MCNWLDRSRSFLSKKRFIAILVSPDILQLLVGTNLIKIRFFLNKSEAVKSII